MKGDPTYVDDTLGSAGAAPHRHPSPFAPPAAPPPPQKQGGGCFQKWLLVVGAIVIVSFGGCFIGLAVLGATAPPEYALPGQQLPKQEREAINDLALLRPGERIVYFYAEGFSAEDKMVFFTDTRLVTYDDDLPRPDFEVPLSQVRSVRVIYREGFLELSDFIVETDTNQVTFGVANDRNGDEEFHRALSKSVRAAGGSAK